MIKWWSYMKSLMFTKVSTSHPEGGVNAKFHGNPFARNDICRPDRKVRGSPKSLGYFVWAKWISLPNCMAIHPIDVRTFHKRAQKWTSWWCKRKGEKEHLGTSAQNVLLIQWCSHFLSYPASEAKKSLCPPPQQKWTKFFINHSNQYRQVK